MKKNVMYVLKTVAVFAIFAIILTGCDPTEDTGEDRDNFVGSWTCFETDANNVQASFPVTISKDLVNTDRVLFANFGNIGNTAKPYGTVTGTSVTIPAQTVNGYNVAGSGSYNAGTQKVTLSYTVNGDAYTATLE